MNTIEKQSTNSGSFEPVSDKESSAAPSMASNEFHKFLADIEDLVKATTSLTGEDLAKAKAELVDRIAVAKHSLADASSNVAIRAKKAADISNTYVHDQPWRVIGVSSVVGFLLGYMMARRS